MEWKVWYQSKAKQLGFGYKSGVLLVEPGKATFRSDGETIEMAPIRSVGRQWISLWLHWVDLEYGLDGDVRHAYLGDRRMLGWSGILGSNGKLAEDLRAAQAGGGQTP